MPSDQGNSREHTVWCSRCEACDTQPEHLESRMIVVVKANGWARLNGKWFCPDCVAELKKEL